MYQPLISFNARMAAISLVALTVSYLDPRPELHLLVLQFFLAALAGMHLDQALRDNQLYGHWQQLYMAGSRALGLTYSALMGRAMTEYVLPGLQLDTFAWLPDVFQAVTWGAGFVVVTCALALVAKDPAAPLSSRY